MLPGGSPPRAWGRRRRPGHAHQSSRFTPTCVGTALHHPRPGPAHPVHPHVRGDGKCMMGITAGLHGSPPRAWGRPRRPCRWRVRARFTPTCVGTAPPPCILPPWPAVHPHVRGDGARGYFSQLLFGGSPPRAWGRRGRPGEPARPLRFTPTCVGTATPSNRTRRVGTVHPHVRGDGISNVNAAIAAYGSPPRAWGRPVSTRAPGPPNRFTPTCVGTASGLSSLVGLPPVHPHVRGDGRFLDRRHVISLGSPPRAWGRQVHDGHNGGPTRFTPTCVGTASPVGWFWSSISVHPHVRGDGTGITLA